MMANFDKKLTDIEILLNHLRSQKAALEFKVKIQKNKQRKMRTRTLIQLDGPFNLTPLLSICDIELGIDLQLEYQDKAAILLGILINATNQLPENISENDLAHFKTIGMNHYRKW